MVAQSDTSNPGEALITIFWLLLIAILVAFGATAYVNGRAEIHASSIPVSKVQPVPATQEEIDFCSQYDNMFAFAVKDTHSLRICALPNEDSIITLEYDERNNIIHGTKIKIGHWEFKDLVEYLDKIGYSLRSFVKGKMP